MPEFADFSEAVARRYADLAEKPDGFTFPWGTHHVGGFSLNPLDPAGSFL